MTAEQVIAQFTAKLAADDAKFRADRDRLNSDARFNALNAYAESLEPKLADGMAGGRLTFAYLFSSNLHRKARANHLALARRAQLLGKREAAAIWLNRAKYARRQEKPYPVSRPSLIAAE